MKKALWFLVAVFAFASCSDANKELLNKLEMAIKEGEAPATGYKTIRMTSLTDFDWDTMYFFQAYETKKDISDAIGFKWEGPEVKDGNRRLLFVKGEEVVSYTDYNYREFPLFVYGCEGDKWVYPKSRSEFASFKYCDGDTETFTFIPVACVGNIKNLMQLKCAEERN